jgi:uncharacterized protein (DUF927 family)
VVQYLADFRAANKTKPIQATYGYGWTDDSKSFIIGNDCIGEPAISLAAPHEARGLTVAGTWDGYKAAVKKHLSHHPKILCGILAACSAPLLGPLEAQGFTFSYAGETSSGKGTAQHAIAAAYGHPFHVFKSWASSSMVGLYNNLAAAGDLPVIFEDTKDVKDPAYVVHILHAVTEGKEPGKGKQDGGNREPMTWRTVLITSGETSITSFGMKSGGAAARALEFRGQTFNGVAADIGPMHDDFRRHHGHLIRKVILSAMGRTAELRNLHNQFKLELSASSTGGVESRMYEGVATMMVAASVCGDVGLGISFTEALAAMRGAVQASAKEADRAGEACDRILARAVAHRASFFNGDNRSRAPSGGWLGYWKDDYAYDHIGILPDVFDKWMKEDGFHPGDILTALRQRGLLVVDGVNHARCVSMGGSRLVTILRSAFK